MESKLTLDQSFSATTQQREKSELERADDHKSSFITES
jgi:hypothetical protein